MENGAVGRAQGWEAFARGTDARDVGTFARALRSTRLGSAAKQRLGGTFSARASSKLQHPCKTSGRAAVYGLRSGSIRKKIIGRGMRAIAAGVAFGKHVRRPGRTISLLQEQARQHGSGVFFHPLIKQGGNLLAEIGGMREARQLKTLQGVPRSGEKELPGRLGRTGGHWASDREWCAYYVYSNQCQEYLQVMGCGNLWKTFQPRVARAVDQC
jgi:hypothetical protein